ncbi:MAG: AraC-like DNA-binding protein [Candidatus Azotimanducaceae bacterium]|jgi:AraC-like DNA-binding protein
MYANTSLDKRAVPMAQVVSVVQALTARGYSQEQALVGTGLIPADLDNLDLRVSYRQRIQQLSNMLMLIDNGGFWLDYPAEVSISDYGLLGYAMMSSATLEKAVQIGVKYHRMAGSLFDLAFVKEEQHAVLRLDEVLAKDDVGQYVTESLFVGLTPLIGLLIGESFQPTEVHFDYPQPAYAAKFEAAFGCPVYFEKPFCEFHFDVELLTHALAEADSNTALTCEESCRKILSQLDIGVDIISNICHLLLSTPGEFPKLDAIANKLSIGTRTLRRRLKGLGTSYQKILDDVKKELAIEYLQTTTLSVQEISDLLGYSEVTNFRRAFVKWVHLSPYQYRKQIESFAELKDKL